MMLDRRLWSEARAARFGMTLSVGAGLLVGAFAVCQAYALSQVIGQVFLRGRSLEQVREWLVILLAVILIRAGLVWLREAAAARAAVQIKENLRQRLLAHLIALGPSYLRGDRTGELASTFEEGVESLEVYFAQYLPSLALAALVPLTILLFVFPLDWVSGLVFLLTAPLIPIFMVLIGKAAEVLTRRQWESLSRLSAHFLDVMQGLTTLKLLGRSQIQVWSIAEATEHFREATMGVLRVAFLSALVLELMATISTAIVAVEVGLRLLYGGLAFEQAFFVLILAPEFYLPLRALGASFHAGQAGVAVANRLFQMLETPLPPMGEASQSGSAAARVAISIVQRPLGSEIRFEDVCCAYEGGERPALRGVSFRIGSGEKVALVGPSGAGKSTVAHLLLRFVEPCQGAIFVGDVPLQDMPAADWRQCVAWVPQSPYLFPGTVAENIRMARPGATDEELLEAATLANADEFIDLLPQRYETPIGERGARLSGGQAQRLALARAFLKNAPLLILDEPTANLDPEAESLFLEAAGRLFRGRTALVIAHRLPTVVNADRIVVLVAGRVVESGTHQNLWAKGGTYRQMVAAYGGVS